MYEEQLELAILVCKRLFPDYKNFYTENSRGDPNVLKDTIQFCQNQDKETLNINIIDNLLLKIDDITPETEDFENASYALNACTSVYETLEFIKDKNQNHIINIGSYLTDTVDFKIQDDKELTEQEIDNHPLMIEARNFLLAIS